MTQRDTLPSRWKLTLVATTIVVLSLLVAALAVSQFDRSAYQAQRLKEMTAQANVLATNAVASIVFDDADTTRELLETLRVNPEVDGSAIYGAAGQLIAAYRPANADPVPETVSKAVTFFGDQYATVVEPIVQDGRRIGSVYLRTLTEPFAQRIQRYVGLLLLVVMASVMVAALGIAQVTLRQANLHLQERAEELFTLNRNLVNEIQEREKAEDALRQAQKMEAVGQLTGGIAHDFNNMLAIIMGGLSLLKRRAHGRSDLESLADSALEGARRAATLTQRLLAFSRRQALQPQPIEPNRLISGMAELLRRALGETIQVEIVLAAGGWRVNADAHELEASILNLATNSRDAMLDGGKLTIETANVHLDERYAAEGGVPPGQYVMVAVTDTGQGMPPDVAARAFEPFFTTKPVGKGTGLGLSQVYGFVRQSSGHVKIYSESGEGTTVKIYLPRLITAATIEEIMVSEPIARGTNATTILVVEDEDGVRKLTVASLDELGYRVIEANGGAAALRILASDQEITLLFTDVVMPGMNGRKLADEALRLRPNLKVLYTTGYTRNAVVHNGVLDPGVHLLSKPFSLEDLSRKIRTVLGEQAEKNHGDQSSESVDRGGGQGQ